MNHHRMAWAAKLSRMREEDKIYPGMSRGTSTWTRRGIFRSISWTGTYGLRHWTQSYSWSEEPVDVMAEIRRKRQEALDNYVVDFQI